MIRDKIRLSDVDKHETSPFACAILERDRQTMSMVADALRQGRLRLAYQPVVIALNTDRIGFYEGLMRVLDPSGVAIPARDFMPAVEAHEIGREIDCAALAMGLKTLAEHPEVRLSINMSARSIGYQKWRQILHHGLRRSAAIGERLILEITESSAMQTPELVVAFMEELQREGIAFALDDFGAGYTAIRYFKDFFFDILKIDGQFIRNIKSDPDNQIVVAALLSIGKQFDMVCIAESVEDVGDAEILRAMGMDCLQGYLFGAPTITPPWQSKVRRATA